MATKQSTEQKKSDETPEGTDKDVTPAAEEKQAGPAAAPLEPPQIPQGKPEAALGSSTNPVAAAAAVQTMPGDRHDRLVTESVPGVFNEADPGDLWFDPGAHFTYVQARHRIHEEFFHVGAARPDRRLLFPQGANVPRDQAANLTNKVRDQLAKHHPDPDGAADSDDQGE